MTDARSSTKGSPPLLVAWRYSKIVHGRKLHTGGDLQEYLDEIVQKTDARIDDAETEPYRPDVGETEENTVFTAERNDRIDSHLIDVLSKGEDLELATENELRRRSFLCYALTTRVDDSPKIYIRRQNPVRLSKRRLFSRLTDGPITELTTPVLSFDDIIDVVIDGDEIFILNPKGFESLFRHSELVLEAVAEWVGELHRTVPLSDQTRAILETAAEKNSFHRGKLLAILESDYLDSVTLDDIRGQMKKHGLKHQKLIEGDTIHLEESDVDIFLKLVNEDLFRGDFSDRHFAASGKRVVR